MQQYLEAGKVVTTHGVRGEMKLELWCDGVNFLKKVGRLYASAQGGRAWKIVSIRAQGQMALLQLEVMHMTDYSKITALYSRLSVGDEDRDGGESNSIQKKKYFWRTMPEGGT